MDLRGDLKTIKNTLRNGSDGSCSASDSSIEIKSDYGCQKTIDHETCSVCLEKRCNTMLLPCSHQFHAECIIQWTERQFSCPMCRSEISHFVPLRNMKSQQEADFVKLWENHYMTPSPRPKVSPVVKKTAAIVSTGTSKAKLVKRSPSMSNLKALEIQPEKPEPHECKNCKGSLKNEFVYFAFDKKFCSTPCRLKYARSKMPKKSAFDEGTTSFYVDFSQVMKYMTKRAPEAIDVREVLDFWKSKWNSLLFVEPSKSFQNLFPPFVFPYQCLLKSFIVRGLICHFHIQKNENIIHLSLKIESDRDNVILDSSG